MQKFLSVSYLYSLKYFSKLTNFAVCPVCEESDLWSGVHNTGVQSALLPGTFAYVPYYLSPSRP